MKEKKYTIELTEKQARLLSWACDTLPRLIQGQDWTYQGLMESAWERRSKEATGNMMDIEFEGGWYKMREDAERLCKEIKQKFWGLPINAMHGIHYDDTADILFDIHQVIRHKLWQDDPDPNKSRMTVDASPASQVGSEPLCKVISYDTEAIAAFAQEAGKLGRKVGKGCVFGKTKQEVSAEVLKRYNELRKNESNPD